MGYLDKVQQLLADISFEDQLRFFLRRSIESDSPMAIWRKPGETVIYALCQLDNTKYSIEEIETAPKGFLFCPFEKNRKRPEVFIKGDIVFNSENDQISVDPTLSNSESLDKFLKGLGESDNKLLPHPSGSIESNTNDPLLSDKSTYTNFVAKCVEVIRSGQYQKIVPSRAKRIDLLESFDPIKEFLKLSDSYTNAFVSIVQLPDQGMWMGATPELLLSVEDKKKFTTVSLAGTQVIEPDFPVAKAPWTQKEIEEQAMVSRYIINCFKKIRLREFEEYGPKTVRAGNLAHLKTIFEVDMEAVNFPQLGTVMLELLHPTSAVCGMPMKSTFEFLNEHEGYDREYYSGYLGPTNIQNETRLFVNLRCMKLHNGSATLYAGAGVTEDSDPESEWNETEVKLQTLLNVLNK